MYDQWPNVKFKTASMAPAVSNNLRRIIENDSQTVNKCPVCALCKAMSFTEFPTKLQRIYLRLSAN